MGNPLRLFRGLEPLDVASPPTIQQLADVNGNNAYFNNINGNVGTLQSLTVNGNPITGVAGVPLLAYVNGGSLGSAYGIPNTYSDIPLDSSPISIPSRGNWLFLLSVTVQSTAVGPQTIQIRLVDVAVTTALCSTSFTLTANAESAVLSTFAIAIVSAAGNQYKAQIISSLAASANVLPSPSQLLNNAPKLLAIQLTTF